MANVTYGTNIKYAAVDPTVAPSAGGDVLHINTLTGKLWLFNTLTNTWECVTCNSVTAANNGLTLSGGNTVQLGGALIQDTTVNGSSLRQMLWNNIHTYTVNTARTPSSYTSTLSLGSSAASGVIMSHQNVSTPTTQSNFQLNGSTGNLYKMQSSTASSQVQQYLFAALDVRTEIQSSDGTVGATFILSKNKGYIAADGTTTNPIFEVDSTSGTSALRLSQSGVKTFELATPSNSGDYTPASNTGDALQIAYQGNLMLASRFSGSVRFLTGSTDGTSTGEVIRADILSSGILRTLYGRVVSTRTITATYTVVDQDEVIYVQNGGTAVVITFPNATTSPGRVLTVARRTASTGSITIAPAGSTQVEAAAGTFAATTTLAALGVAGSRVTFVSNGASWGRIN